jgi:peptidoglycan-N-acetylglucosamine deacetylase
MLWFLEISNGTLFVYYLLSNLFYFVLLIVALCTSAAHQRRIHSVRLDRMKLSPLMPPISLIAPAHNEEKSIVDSVESFLSINYPELEVIVVNDGSADSTLSKLQRHFELLPADIVYVNDVPCERIRGLYVSRSEPRLLVVDKESGGSKAGAVNAGLNAASHPYVCVVDADSILENDALLRIMVGAKRPAPCGRRGRHRARHERIARRPRQAARSPSAQKLARGHSSNRIPSRVFNRP